jgi:hypothetical protein
VVAITRFEGNGWLAEEKYYDEQALGGLASRSAYTNEGDRLASSADYTYGTQLANR